MFTKAIFIFYVIVCIKGNEPQVYEPNEDQVAANTRVARDPFNQQKPKTYKPPVFEYQSALQQDQRKNRYVQQQKVDMENLLKKKSSNKAEAPLRLSLVQNWKVIEPTVSSSSVEEDYKLPEDKMDKVPAITSTRKPVTSRKLKQASYYEDMDDTKTNVKRRDSNNQLLYVSPEEIKQQFSPRSEQDLNALNALVGQHPTLQLEGLKKLLESSQSNYVLPPIKGPLPTKDHTPIIEQIIDIPNPQSKPNIKVDHGGLNLEALQSQLDAETKIQVEKALLEAQREAMAEVEAQHHAIAKAQEAARLKALEQIRLHNEGIKPLALPLQVEVQHEFKPLALPLKGEGDLYTSRHQVPTVETVNVKENDGKKKRLEKVSITKTHSIKQEQKSPNAYQEVVLETQHQTQKVFPDADHHQLDGTEDDHLYDARYAFGYKVRDAKMGNEFGHQEKRDQKNTEGNYHVLLPDGRVQKVEYYADPSGYHAKVTYQNLAHH